MEHIAILGAGPIGLEAALAALETGASVRVYEATADVAGNVRAWAHVRLFTPWSMNVSPRARRVLEGAGVEIPGGEACPTGGELVDRLLRPLAQSEPLRGCVEYGAEVVAVSREGLLKSDEIGTGRRAERPFRILLRGPDGSERVETASVVLDCTGAYHNPNALGAGRIPAPGERAAEAHIVRRVPDVLGTPDAWAGRRILLVGAGHSAQTAARDLAALARERPDTSVVWAVRSEAPSFGAVEDDPLAERAALVEEARALAFDGGSPLDVRLGRSVEALAATGDGIAVTLRTAAGGTETVEVDRIVALTGAVGDHSIYRQLQVHECWATSGPMKLAAALLGSDSADCLDQTTHGAETLANPEPGFFIVGRKSYGRNNTFLLRVGWQQVDEVFSLLRAPAAAGERA